MLSSIILAVLVVFFREALCVAFGFGVRTSLYYSWSDETRYREISTFKITNKVITSS
jgi:hypothetical protein